MSALLRLPEPQRSCALIGIATSPNDDWRSANASRTAARAALVDLRPLCLSPLAR